jgi:hypothetical protein
MTNDSKVTETKAAFAAISKASQDAADNAAVKVLAFTQALARYDRRLKRDGLWP